MIDFRLSEEQELLADTAAALLDAECPTTLLRAVTNDPAAAQTLWSRLRDFAALATGPTSDLVVFLDAHGYVAAPGVFFPTVALFGSLMASVDPATADQVAAGDLTGTVAIANSSGLWSPHAEPTKHQVLEMSSVDVVAVITPGPRVGLFPVEELAPVEVEMIDRSRRVFLLPNSPVGTTEIDPGALDRWVDRARVAFAAEMVGTARRCFDMALAYAKQREQFDTPIGAFQAIQHKLAEAGLAVEQATAAVQFAAMAIDADAAERTRAAHVAKAAAGRAARRSLKDSIQIHGGIGYTWEHDLHLFLRRATTSEFLFGTTGWHHDRIAALIE